MNEIFEAYQAACREHRQAWDFFDQAGPDQVVEAISWISLTEQKVARLKRELEREMGKLA